MDSLHNTAGVPTFLLNALNASRSTEDNRKTFSELDLTRPVAEVAKRDPKTRNVVMEVLKKFGPGKCRFGVLAVLCS